MWNQKTGARTTNYGSRVDFILAATGRPAALSSTAVDEPAATSATAVDRAVNSSPAAESSSALVVDAADCAGASVSNAAVTENDELPSTSSATQVSDCGDMTG